MHFIVVGKAAVDDAVANAINKASKQFFVKTNTFFLNQLNSISSIYDF